MWVLLISLGLWDKDDLVFHSHANNQFCTSFFTKPMEWMHIPLGLISGKLFCPKCHYRLGSFHMAGIQCSCGSWVSPGYQLHQKKVRWTLAKLQ
ncbi:dual specificity protein phosphatase 12-like [Zophobas morio]|uniref:dual specificity protein phosphatase 12-like n=1 Tax=Zophobas morio TaxID=2755281 RepID=UPI003082E7A6